MAAAQILIRPGGPADLGAVMAIWHACETAGDPSPPPPPPVLAEYPHLLATGKLWVAERGGQPVGFSGAVRRGEVAFLTDLFVDPTRQSAGVGALLLRAALDEHAGRARCTVSSSDPRALALYARYGMRPQWPNLLLRGRAADVAGLAARAADLGAVAEEAAPGDEEIIAWDAAAGGRPRPEDHAFWAREEAGRSLWASVGGRRVGYAVVRAVAPGVLRVGPAGARDPEGARAALVAALAWAARRAPQLRCDLPGPHEALADLLAAGMRIADSETFMLDAPAPIVDPRVYVGSGGALF